MKATVYRDIGDIRVENVPDSKIQPHTHATATDGVANRDEAVISEVQELTKVKQNPF